MRKLIILVIIFSFVCIPITFAEDIPIESIKVSVSDTNMEVGTSQKVKVVATPANAVNGDYEYSSSDSNIVTAAVGTIIANKVGVATITVKLKNSEISDSITIEVVQLGILTPEPSPTPPVTPTPTPEPTNQPNSEISVRSVEVYDQDTLVKNPVEIMATQTKQFFAKVYPSNATDQSIRWRSDDADIAMVDNNGIIKGIKVGETEVYAIANDNGRSYTVKVKVIPYVRSPDSISIAPENKPTFKTGESFKMKVNFLPEDTTERAINWFIYGNCATVDQNGNVAILDKGKIKIKAYTKDYKQSATFEFDSTYADNHFTEIKELFIKTNKSVMLTFDSYINQNSLTENIFIATDPNGEAVPFNVILNGNDVYITPKNGFTEGISYIFIKSTLSDIYGNQLGKSVKCKVNARRSM